MTSAKWHLASEPPNNSRSVLVRCSSGPFGCARWGRFNNAWIQRGHDLPGRITHWRELPEFVDPESEASSQAVPEKRSEVMNHALLTLEELEEWAGNMPMHERARRLFDVARYGAAAREMIEKAKGNAHLVGPLRPVAVFEELENRIASRLAAPKPAEPMSEAEEVLEFVTKVGPVGPSTFEQGFTAWLTTKEGNGTRPSQGYYGPTPIAAVRAAKASKNGGA